jgi:hypothetical protein
MTFGGIGAAHQQLAVAGLSEIFPNKYRAYVQGNVSYLDELEKKLM